MSHEGFFITCKFLISDLLTRRKLDLALFLKKQVGRDVLGPPCLMAFPSLGAPGGLRDPVAPYLSAKCFFVFRKYSLKSRSIHRRISWEP